MNKLISKNPVQRFKQGRKIVLKAQLGGYMFGKMGGWNRSMGNTISDQESLNYLKEMGLDGQNALQIQQYINQQLGNNSVKEDNKWGNQSRAGLKALYENWKLQQKPQTQSPIGNPVIESQRALAENPQLTQDQLMFNNINSKTFNAPLPPRTIPYDRSMTRDIIKDITGNSAYNFTGDQRKALRQYLNGEQYDQEAIKAFGDLKQYDKYMKWRLQKGGILPSRNIVERFKNGRKIDIFKDGGVKRYSVNHTDSKKTVYFDTEEQAKAYQKKQKAGTTVRRDGKKEASGQVLKVDRTKEKATQYGRQQLEKNNNLSFKQAYQAARKSGNKYFAYKGKVYKSDLENGKDNMTEMAQHYGNNLGYSGDPKLGTKQSMAARAQYRKDIDAKKGNRNANYQGKTNKQASAEADKKVAQTWNERDFVDAILPATAVGNTLNAAGSWMSGEKFTPKVFHSGLNAAGGMADLMEGNWSNVGERALNAASIFGGPWIGKGVKWLGVKAAPKIATVSDKSRYLFNTPGTKIGTKFLEDGSGKVLNNFAEGAISKGNGFRFGTGASSYGRYSIQNAIDQGVLNGNKVLPKVSQWANTAVRNGNTGTTYFYRNVDKAGNLISHPYDTAVDNAVKLFPWLSSVGGSVSSTTLNNFSE